MSNLCSHRVPILWPGFSAGGHGSGKLQVIIIPTIIIILIIVTIEILVKVVIVVEIMVIIVIVCSGALVGSRGFHVG